MRSLRTPAVVLLFLYLCFFSFLVFSGSQLPERVATHFDGAGRPDGWMSRSSHLAFMAIFGLAFPLLVVALCFALRFLPARAINIPHSDYWLAPARRMQTFHYLFRHSLWFACMAVIFVMGMHLLLLNANGRSQPEVSTPLTLIVAGCFLAGVIGWVICLVSRFGSTGADHQTSIQPAPQDTK